MGDTWAIHGRYKGDTWAIQGLYGFQVFFANYKSSRGGLLIYNSLRFLICAKTLGNHIALVSPLYRPCIAHVSPMYRPRIAHVPPPSRPLASASPAVWCTSLSGNRIRRYLWCVFECYIHMCRVSIATQSAAFYPSLLKPSHFHTSSLLCACVCVHAD